MLLNFLIWINKRKLDKMITSDYTYDEILKQSQKLDWYINIWYRAEIRFKDKFWQHFWQRFFYKIYKKYKILKVQNKNKKYIEMLEINVFSLEPTTGIEPVTSALPIKKSKSQDALYINNCR